MTVDLTSYKHVIWDWNGTLLNDTPLTHQILLESLALLPSATAPDFEEWRNSVYFPMTSYYETLLAGFTPDQVLAVREQWAIRYEQRAASCSLQPGAQQLISRLNEHLVRQSILSAHTRPDLERVIRQHGIHDFFAEICGLPPGAGGGSKLNLGRSLLDQATDLHQIAAEEHVIIGDSFHDAEVARELGIDCVLVANGLMPAKRLKESGFPVVGTLTELL